MTRPRPRDSSRLRGAVSHRADSDSYSRPAALLQENLRPCARIFGQVPGLDLSAHGRLLRVVSEEVLAEQVRYYRARAREADIAYARTGLFDEGLVANDALRAEFGELVSAFDNVTLGDEVLEVAAGTGFWTERLVERGAMVTAVDAAPEALDMSRKRLGDRSSSVEYVLADLFRWRPTRRWDSCVGFFWLCKIPDDRLRSLLRTLVAAVEPGGTVFFGDKTPVVGAQPSVESETRLLNDGRAFTIVDRPRSPSEFREAFAAVGVDVDVAVVGTRFSAVSGTR